MGLTQFQKTPYKMRIAYDFIYPLLTLTFPIWDNNIQQDPPPGYPSSTIVLHAHEARALSFISLPFGDGITFYDRVITAMKDSDVISIRTCKDIEGNLCDYMANQFEKSVFNQTSVTRAC